VFGGHLGAGALSREPIRFEMRADTGQQGAPVRIMRLRLANDETFPDR